MRELLAAIIFIKQFHHYLWGRKFTLRTDHVSLKWLVSFKNPEGKLARWLSVLSGYDFEVEHRSGVTHINADALSRQNLKKCKRSDCEDCSLEKSDCVCVVTGSQSKETEKVEDYDLNLEVKDGDRLGQGSLDLENVTVSTSDLVSNSDRLDYSKNVKTDGNSIVSNTNPTQGSRIVLENNQINCNWLESYTKIQLKSFQNNDRDINFVLDLKNSSSQKPDKTAISGKSSEIKKLCAQWDRLHICDGVLYREWIPENPSDRKLLQYVIPKNMRSEIF